MNEDIVERLRAQVKNQRGHWTGALFGEAADEIERLRATLAEALDEYEDMLSYVDEYFQEKWGFPSTLRRLRESLNATPDLRQ